MFVYKIDVLEELKNAGYTTHVLRQGKLLGEANIQKLRRSEIVGIIALDTICSLLNKQPGEIIEFRQECPDEKSPR